ncbi:MAG: LD-carboxypeptidase [Candidatus Limimorpha sp.]
MRSPEYLKKGSKIAIAAPARKIRLSEIQDAIEWIRRKGFEPVFDERLFLERNQFAGDERQRAAVLQDYLDREDIDAIFCARGGYGTIRIIDLLDFSKFGQKPKWVVGYSDITVLHAKIQGLGYRSIHATMPINFPCNSDAALESLYEALTGGGSAEGIFSGQWLKGFDNREYKELERYEVRGGNLSVLYSMIGSDIFPDTDGRLLFIEDVDEYLYHIDRMMTALKRAGKLSKLKGLIVGAFTDIHDNSIPFGMTVREIITEKVSEYGYPVIWDYPAGHISDNHAIILG